ncbi:hypothetical protein H4Q26_002001 [Puccinia striiformis f. sp. tritici PST-130]|nr:hypothetical protein H4Q26_002001 [Puccinia striiformis f. sp. tritici PST-130]
MAGPPVMPLRYRDTSTKAQHPIRLYGRHGDKIHILLRITADDSRELIQGFVCQSCQIQQVLMARGSTTFSKIVNK